MLAIEGPVWLLGDLDTRWWDDDERGRLMRAARAVEHEASVLGVSAHQLANGRAR